MTLLLLLLLQTLVLDQRRLLHTQQKPGAKNHVILLHVSCVVGTEAAADSPVRVPLHEEFRPPPAAGRTKGQRHWFHIWVKQCNLVSVFNYMDNSDNVKMMYLILHLL